jgi:single-stranded-DNA-specific exonuclease
MAAGLKIRQENIAEFQQAFEMAVRGITQSEDLEQKLEIDGELDFATISGGLIDELESLMPYGAGNPEPLFVSSNVKVVSSKILGGCHRLMVLRQPSAGGAPSLQAIHFNADEPGLRQSKFSKVVFRLRWNRWNGQKTAQIVVEDLQ